MRISLAPFIKIISESNVDDKVFKNLSLTDLPSYVTLIVPKNWEKVLEENKSLTENWKMWSLIIKLPVEYFEETKKANYIKLIPDIIPLIHPDFLKDITRNQILSLVTEGKGKKIFSGIQDLDEKIEILIDKKPHQFLHFDPYGESDLRSYILSFEPKLDQLKHTCKERKVGGKIVSPFSALNDPDEHYAVELLQTAYKDYLGDVDDDTYLYTYDYKYKTFVEFRPSRNNSYHGMDIDYKAAKQKAPEIVKKFNM